MTILGILGRFSKIHLDINLLVITITNRTIQAIRRTNPPGQIDRTQTIHHPIQLLLRWALSFQN